MVFLASASTLPRLVVRTESGGDGSPKSYCLVATAFGQRLLSATRALVVVSIMWYSTGNIHGWAHTQIPNGFTVTGVKKITLKPSVCSLTISKCYG